MNCPICGTEIDEYEHKLAEKLTKLGYMHLDVWLKCPKCKYTPCFGKEMEDTKPIYFYPKKLPFWFRKKLEEAFHKYIPPIPCAICGAETELHKIWINIWKKVKEENASEKVPLKSVADKETLLNFQFLVPTTEGGISRYFLPAGVLGQYKCTNWKCKYVRYVTL